MAEVAPLWIREREVVELLDLADAIRALERALVQQARGYAHNLDKTVLGFGKGDTLHALGAVFASEGVCGTKTWAHTEGGATPLLALFDTKDGALLAVIEAFALGQVSESDHVVHVVAAMGSVAPRRPLQPQVPLFAAMTWSVNPDAAARRASRFERARALEANAPPQVVLRI